MFVNKIPFIITISRYIKFITVEVLKNRQTKTLSKILRNVTSMYEKRGFIVSSILGDCEFEPLRADFPQLNTTSANEHVPEAERCIRTIKERTRSTYTILPFTYIPRLVIIHLVKNSVLWLNALPAKDGVSNNHSPRYLLTGAELNYENHVQIEFGKYVQTHEEHDNSMQARTMGAICLGPSGNRQGGHWFMSLTSGSRVTRYKWTELPMPTDVINRVNHMGRSQGMSSIMYQDNSDDDDDSKDDDDSDYNDDSEDDDDSDYDDDNHFDYDSDNDNDDHDSESTGVNDDAHDSENIDDAHDSESTGVIDGDEVDDKDSESTGVIDDNHDPSNTGTIDDDECTEVVTNEEAEGSLTVYLTIIHPDTC